MVADRFGQTFPTSTLILDVTGGYTTFSSFSVQTLSLAPKDAVLLMSGGLVTLEKIKVIRYRHEKSSNRKRFGVMKSLGIIGGVGPESTIDYYRKIISLYRQCKGDGSYPELIINSIDLKKEIDLVERNQLDELTAYLLEEVEKLARAGAEVGLIASNTPHIVFGELRPRSRIPLISIVESTCDVAKEMKLKRVGLFGTRFTMQGTFYPDVFVREGIELVVPEVEDQNYVHDKYMSELVNGVFLPETRERLLKIVDRLRTTQRIEGLILGGTELPLILTDETHNGLPILNTTKIHCQAAVTQMLL